MSQIAFDAFMKCIGAYPYEYTDTRVSELPEALLSVVDRLTYIATIEILRPLSFGSLLQNNRRIPSHIVTKLMERQIRSLESLSGKASVRSAMRQILSECMSIYGEHSPLHRCRLMIKRLEIEYKSPQGEETFDYDSIGSKIMRVLQQSVGGLH